MFPALNELTLDICDYINVEVVSSTITRHRIFAVSRMLYGPVTASNSLKVLRLAIKSFALWIDNVPTSTFYENIIAKISIALNVHPETGRKFSIKRNQDEPRVTPTYKRPKLVETSQDMWTWHAEEDRTLVWNGPKPL